MQLLPHDKFISNIQYCDFHAWYYIFISQYSDIYNLVFRYYIFDPNYLYVIMIYHRRANHLKFDFYSDIWKLLVFIETLDIF